MSEFRSLRKRFIQFMEQLVEQRGFKSVHGRILACLILSDSPCTQHDISKWTKYSISTVSRALDQMIAIGSIKRFKQPGIRSYVYEVGINTTNLITGALESWLVIVEKARQPISAMVESAKRIDATGLNDTEANENQRLSILLADMDRTLSKVRPVFEEAVKKLRSLNESF